MKIQETKVFAEEQQDPAVTEYILQKLQRHKDEKKK